MTNETEFDRKSTNTFSYKENKDHILVDGQERITSKMF